MCIKSSTTKEDGMRYVKIPIKDNEEGKRLAEDHLGVLMWRLMEDGSIVAYPYDNENPVILTIPE